jgi:uncharacterized membrane protein YhhN
MCAGTSTSASASIRANSTAAPPAPPARRRQRNNTKITSLLGDVLLMPAVDNFVGGLAAFLFGHVAFVVLFFQYGLEKVSLAGLAIVVVALLGAGPGRVIVQGAAHADAKLRIPVLAYLLVISTMAVVGWSTANPWVIAGTTLFVVSDSVLGWRQFVGQRSWMGPAVMITYHGAIACLALSLW